MTPDGRKKQVGLSNAVEMALLHTPTSTANQMAPSMIERDAGSYGHGMLPESAASDHKGSSQPGQRRGQLSETVAGMKLNPDWVCRMMGFPDDWLGVQTSNEDLAGGRVLQDWAFLEDGTRVRVYKKPGEPWREVGT